MQGGDNEGGLEGWRRKLKNVGGVNWVKGSV